MRKMYIVTAFALTAALVVGLVGCGGGGGGGGEGADLVGIWQIFAASEDGVTIAPAEAMGWAVGTTRKTIEFNADGTCVDRTYDNTKVLIGTENGTWEVQGGVLTITFDPDVVELTYAIDGNLLATTEDDGATEWILRWAKVVNLAGHDAAMVRTWLVDAVEVNGVDTPLATYFNFDPGTDAVALLLDEGGDLGAMPLGEHEILDLEEGAWATGGGEVMLTVGPDEMRGAYVANNTSATFLDPDGDGVVFELVAYAPAGQQHDPAVVDEWQATSATVNGAAVALADFFEWDVTTDSMITQFRADGTAISLEYAGLDIVYGGIGDWNTAGATMTVNFDTPQVFDTYVIVGDVITLTGTDGGDVIVLVFTRV